MKIILKIISALGLVLTIIPSLFVFNGTITMQNNYWLMGIGMLLWFGSAPFWMKSKPLEEDN
ncbi:MAG: hypothetical protein JW717_14550 [Marinilabiliaceae bacterium]|nr:hypothetical protein [Marinilabiliaceae bacterium]